MERLRKVMNKQKEASEGAHKLKPKVLQKDVQAFHSELPAAIVESARERDQIFCASERRESKASGEQEGMNKSKWEKRREGREAVSYCLASLSFF